jgi:hypothetical protein
MTGDAMTATLIAARVIFMPVLIIDLACRYCRLAPRPSACPAPLKIAAGHEIVLEISRLQQFDAVSAASSRCCFPGESLMLRGAKIPHHIAVH